MLVKHDTVQRARQLARPGPELAVLLAEAEVPDEAQALLKRHDIEQARYTTLNRDDTTYGHGSKINHQETAGFGPCFHLPDLARVPFRVPIFVPLPCYKDIAHHACLTVEFGEATQQKDI